MRIFKQRKRSAKRSPQQQDTYTHRPSQVDRDGVDKTIADIDRALSMLNHHRW
jgi:hypothetical protein